jgi:hypothetical protein
MVGGDLGCGDSIHRNKREGTQNCALHRPGEKPLKSKHGVNIRIEIGGREGVTKGDMILAPGASSVNLMSG